MSKKKPQGGKRQKRRSERVATQLGFRPERHGSTGPSSKRQKKFAPPAKAHSHAHRPAPEKSKKSGNPVSTASSATPRPVAHKPATPRKVPEALPLKSEKVSAVTRLTNRVFKKPAIQEVVREPTAGGIVFRLSKDRKDIEILLIQDSKGRWTIPKGHIEKGETAKETAIREIGEEAGLYHIEVLLWLGKIHFQYRRVDKLVLMMTQIYLVQALDDHETPHKEQWMKGIKWFKFNDAIDAIEYEDIEKLMLIAKNKIRQGI